MTPSSYLIKFDRQLSEILVDIDHDFSSWDDVYRAQNEALLEVVG